MTQTKFSPGTLLREAREYLDSRLDATAAEAGISFGSLSKIETDKQSLFMDIFFRICEAVDVSPATIMACYVDGKDKPAEERKPLKDYLDEDIADLPFDSKATDGLSIGPLLRDIRLHKNVLLKDVSEKTKILISGIGKIENDQQNLMMDQFLNICDALEVSPVLIMNYYINEKNQPVEERTPFKKYLELAYPVPGAEIKPEPALTPGMALRLARYETQTPLEPIAKAAQISVTSIFDKELSNSKPYMHTFMLMCDAMDVSPVAVMDYYLSEKDIPADDRKSLKSYFQKHPYIQKIAQFSETKNKISVPSGHKQSAHIRLGSTFRRIREHKNITQSDAAEKSHITASQLSMRENLVRPISMDMFFNICDGLQTSPLAVMAYYLNEEGKPLSKRNTIDLYAEQYPYQQLIGEFQSTKNDIQPQSPDSDSSKPAPQPE